MRTCDHSNEHWLARDGVWRCAVCNPPHFESEVVERKGFTQLLLQLDRDDEAEERRRLYGRAA